jgi:cell division protein FtsQ
MIKELKAWSKLWWFLALVGMGVLFFHSITSKKRVIATETKIDIRPQEDGGLMITEAEVRHLLSSWLDSQGVRPLARMPLAELEATLARHPIVDHAQVYYDAGNDLRIRIAQEKPILRIIDGRGASYYLSREGHKIPLSAHHTPRLPVITGDIPLFADSLTRQDGHLFSALLALGIAVHEDPFLLALTEQVHVRKGELILSPKVGRFRFLLGNGEQLQLRLHNIRHYYQQILPGDGWDAHKEIDLRYRNMIVCKQV